jgi:predicted cupin superfamily sugar epimerase
MDHTLLPESDGARRVIESFGLEPHPEGGWYRQTFADEAADGTLRSTAIYYLLARGERSHWHRVRHASEVWHHDAGGPLRLRVSDDSGPVEEHTLGVDVEHGEQPQVVVPVGHRQSAEPLGEWTLVGCTVAPGFDFDEFELAPPGWEPGSG